MNQHTVPYKQPSQFHRTLGCPGWWNLSRDIPEPPSSDAAMEGTIAHAAVPYCYGAQVPFSALEGLWAVCDGRNVTFNNKQVSMVPEHYLQIQIDAPFIDSLRVYRDEIASIRSLTPGSTFDLEVRVEGGLLLPGVFGTVDCRIMRPFDIMYNLDLKFGRGILVDVGKDVGDNAQLTMYSALSLGVDNPHAVELAVATIVQPRKSHPDGLVRQVEYPVDRIYQWVGDVALPAIAAAEEPNAPRRVGTWCTFCPAAQTGACPELKTERQLTLSPAFTADLQPLDKPVTLADVPTGELAKVADASDRIKAWLKEVDAELARRIAQSGESDGWKLISTLGNRQFASEEDVQKATAGILTKNQLYNLKLKSPAQLETQLKGTGMSVKEAKKLVKPLVRRLQGLPKLVPSNNPNPALPPAAQEMFTADK